MGAVQQVLASYGASFSPLDNAKLSEWWNIESLSAVGDGNPISSWVGEKTVYTLTAATTARPTYEDDDGDGMPSVLFDGVDDIMQCAVNSGTLLGSAGDYEIWCVTRLTPGATRAIFDVYGGSNDIGATMRAAEILWNGPKFANGISVAAAPLDDLWHVWRFAKIAGRRIVARDGVSLYDATTTAGTYTLGADTLHLGGAFTFDPLLGGVRHLLTFNSGLSDDEALAMTTYLEGFI